MRSRSRNRAATHVPNALATRLRVAGSKISIAVATALAGTAAPNALVWAEAAADTSSSSSGGLQEVIVTARKREENLQDVPVSIDVFTKKDLQNLAITSFDDYAQKVPSISFI